MRRAALLACLALTASLVDAQSATDSRSGAPGGRIDRRAVVERHRVELRTVDPRSPLTVGNGSIGFTVDITGLQSFPDAYAGGTPLATLSTWGWHSTPVTPVPRLEDALVPYRAGDRDVPYADANDRDGRPVRGGEWLRANPHRLDLGRLGLEILRADGTPVHLADLADTSQGLDLWTGTLTSSFRVDGHEVLVMTAVHPDHDRIAVRVVSPLVGLGRIRLLVAFPYPAGTWSGTQDWSRPNAHVTTMHASRWEATFARRVDDTRYQAVLEWAAPADLRRSGAHAWTLTPRANRRGDATGDTLDATLVFAPDGPGVARADVEATLRASARAWESFWQSGAAIDLSGSRDPRWRELERRIVLSQYLTRLHASGPRPPQETGLVGNSWFGKAHLEMFWWHAAHFALWGRPSHLASALDWYATILPNARATAASQGYAGARWPKMVGPEGRESPSGVGPFLVWQQPHPIHLAELLWRESRDPGVLKRYASIVFESAAFMASFPREGDDGRLHLSPPLIPAQETYGSIRTRVLDPTFELAYWRWALEVAQQWRVRLGMAREPSWDRVRERLALPTIRDGRYAAIAVEPFTTPTDHPSMLMAYGLLPSTDGIDASTMGRTFDWVRANWDWATTWGWDYPVLAMTAARLGRPADAVDALLMDVPKNQWVASGHTPQRTNLPVYLPSNGGLLAAIAMMAGGWDGAPARPAPGFPDDGSWVVWSEGLQRMP
ncbi:hypothetical protein TBR22_A08270 [Luteitalea sp. TBR-22]|uniref:hypothetical protein n=1 Tax=Luteitalea sp. TBR-22 TaxID=2802971 RepID=UPI001AF5CFF9|nr:hypothetical protein [Luteitalea sp. TBR-22]BCS31625.1 hypothetical protein TBR22_A08270 [Luteitalea sp. TBR-22]